VFDGRKMQSDGWAFDRFAAPIRSIEASWECCREDGPKFASCWPLMASQKLVRTIYDSPYLRSFFGPHNQSYARYEGLYRVAVRSQCPITERLSDTDPPHTTCGGAETIPGA
jgi:hypothetical protein